MSQYLHLDGSTGNMPSFEAYQTCRLRIVYNLDSSQQEHTLGLSAYFRRSRLIIMDQVIF
jgi:hypothetical protein